jgi:hypothetical protein
VDTRPFQRHDAARDALVALAHDVMCTEPSNLVASGNTRAWLTARDAARATVGIAAWVARKVGVDGMQERMAILVRHELAWSTNLHDMPISFDGGVDEQVALIATVVSGLIPVFGARSLRSALAFWATERDPSVWQQIAA